MKCQLSQLMLRTLEECTKKTTHTDTHLHRQTYAQRHAWTDTHTHTTHTTHTHTHTPLPDRPTKRRSLKRATWFFMMAVAFLNSAAQLSSLPAERITLVPSGISVSEMTLKGTGRVLLQRQCEGRTLQTKLGLSVRTSSPGWSASTSLKLFSPLNRVRGGDWSGVEAIRRIGGLQRTLCAALASAMLWVPPAVLWSGKTNHNTFGLKAAVNNQLLQAWPDTASATSQTSFWTSPRTCPGASGTKKANATTENRELYGIATGCRST